jgi:Ca2+-transporting ATPase
MVGQGTFLAILAISSFMYCLYGMDLDLERARTLTFTIVVISQLVHSLNCRNDRRSIFAIGLFSNEPLLWAIGVSLLLQVFIVFSSSLHPIFRVTSFDAEHWLLAFGLGVLPLVGMEIWKAVRGGLDLGRRTK